MGIAPPGAQGLRIVPDSRAGPYTRRQRCRFTEIPSMLSIRLRPSRRLAVVLTLAHGAAGAALLLLDASIGWRVTALAVVAGALAATLHRGVLLNARQAIVAVQWDADGGWDVQTRDGRWRQARLMPGAFVTPVLCVLRFRFDDARRARHLVVMGDSLPADEFRRLRVQLTWRAARSHA